MSFQSSNISVCVCRLVLGLLGVLSVTACSTAPYERSDHVRLPSPKPQHMTRQAPKAGPIIVSSQQPLQCVAHARALSGLSLHGDAWTWWQSAKGQYRRGARPKPGAVLVLSRTDTLRRGHIAYVSEIISKREILVEHANWLNRGQIHKRQIVRDVSAAGDWSDVRVWYTPGQVLGKRTYPVSGFIYKAKARGVST